MTHYVASFTGSDQQKVEAAFKAWANDPGSTLDFGNKKYVLSKPIVVKFKDYTYGPGVIRGGMVWNQITYTGDGTMWKFINFKDGKVENLKIRRVPSGVSDTPSTAIEFFTDGSSSRVRIDAVRAQGFDTGFEFNAPNGADMCQFYLCQVDGWENGKTFLFTGSNNLDVEFHSCTSSMGPIGWEMLGGSNFLMVGCGGSQTKEWVRVRGGFPFIAIGGKTEDCGVAYTIGGEGLDGYGQETNCKIDDLVHRGLTTALAKVSKAGHTSVSVLDTARGNNLCELTNKSGKPASFDGFGVTTKTIEGTWNITGTVGTVIKK